jgi:MFS family permease
MPQSGTLGGQRAAGGTQAMGLIVVMLLPTAPLLALVPNLPQLMQHFASVPGHDVLVPMILTLPSICLALLAPVAGTLADRFGRRRTLLYALVLFTVSGLAPLFLSDLRYILIAQLGVGIAESVIMATGNALLGDYFDPEGRRKWLGVQSIVGSICASLFILGGGALGNIDWHAPFLINILGGIAFVWILVATWEPRPADHPAGAAPAESLAVFPWRAMIPIFAVTLATSILYFVQAVNLGLIFSRLGAQSPSTISIATTVASVGVLCGGYFFRRQTRLGTGKALSIVYLAYGIGLMGLGFSTSYLKAVPFGIVAQFGNGMAIPILVNWALRRLDFQYRGRGMGLWATSFFVGQFLSSMVIALIGRVSGGLLDAIAIIGGFCLLLAVASAFFARSEVVAAQPASH